MFVSEMESGIEAGADVLIRMRFVWPYGGTTVYLCGSFTRWAEFVPMLPVEGCPTVFQTVYNLTPGYHQYKFYVDGEWRHDEDKPYAAGEYGTVNTVFLATDPNYIPVINTENAGANMDVDNEAFERLVRISDPRLMDGVRSFSESDLQISRHRISMYIASHTAYDLLPESGKVVALDVELPVKQAFHILYEQGISMAPLWDSGKGQFVGVLSAFDFILILKELGDHGSNLTEEELETHTISAWKEGKAYLCSQIDGQGAAFVKPLIYAGPLDSLKDVSLRILQSRVSTVPIIYSSSEDGSLPQLLHLAALSGILKCICRYFKNCASLLPILQQPICALPLGTWVPKIGEANQRPLAMLTPSASLKSALDLLVQADVSSIPIVDDNDSLVDIYSRSDITALAKDRAYTHINLNEMTIHQALQWGQDSYSPYELSSQRCQMCLRSDSLLKVMEHLSNPGVRRIIIVEAGSKRVEGVISLIDVFKFLLL